MNKERDDELISILTKARLIGKNEDYIWTQEDEDAVNAAGVAVATIVDKRAAERETKARISELENAKTLSEPPIIIKRGKVTYMCTHHNDIEDRIRTLKGQSDE